MKPKVSVIIPTFNRLESLKKAYNSVINQSFSNYEIIITDNSSNDGTKKWIKKIIKKNRKVRSIFHKKNLGMVANWNSGLFLAEGDYIAMLMDDDYWDSEYLKNLVEVLDKKSNVAIATCEVVQFGNLTKIDKNDRTYRLNKGNKIFKGLDCIKNYLSDFWLVGLPSAVIVRKKSLQEFGLFDPICIDQELWLRICQKHDLFYLDKRLVYWRKDNNESFTKKQTLTSSFKRKMRILKKISGYYFPNEKLSEFNKLVKNREKNIRKTMFYLIRQNRNLKSVYLVYWPKWLLFFDWCDLYLIKNPKKNMIKKLYFFLRKINYAR